MTYWHGKDQYIAPRFMNVNFTFECNGTEKHFKTGAGRVTRYVSVMTMYYFTGYIKLQ